MATSNASNQKEGTLPIESLSGDMTSFYNLKYPSGYVEISSNQLIEMNSYINSQLSKRPRKAFIRSSQLSYFTLDSSLHFEKNLKNWEYIGRAECYWWIMTIVYPK